MLLPPPPHAVSALLPLRRCRSIRRSIRHRARRHLVDQGARWSQARLYCRALRLDSRVSRANNRHALSKLLVGRVVQVFTSRLKLIHDPVVSFDAGFHGDSFPLNVSAFPRPLRRGVEEISAIPFFCFLDYQK